MSVKPILFSGPMVRAILEGRKTQTRRVMKPQPHERAEGCYHRPDGSWVWVDAHRENNGVGYAGNRLDDRHFFTPIDTGDLLWVREAHSIQSDFNRHDGFVNYKANDHDWHTGPNTGDIPDDSLAAWFRVIDRSHDMKCAPINRPSIHMPRWASRLTLRVTDVRVQRLQEISTKDALAEGMTFPDGMKWGCDPVDAFHNLWDGLNAKRGFGWDQNPWVAAYTFEVIRQNVDEVAA